MDYEKKKITRLQITELQKKKIITRLQITGLLGEKKNFDYRLQDYEKKKLLGYRLQDY